MLTDTLNKIKKIFVGGIIALFLFPALSIAQDYSFKSMIPQNGDQRLEEATDLAVSSSGNYFIVDKDKGAIFKYDSTGQALETIKGVEIDGKNISFEEPFTIFLNQKNDLFVADKDLDKIFVLKKDGKNQVLGKPGKNLGELHDLGPITVDSQDYTYIVSRKNNHVVVFAPDGRYQTWINAYTKGFDDIASIEVDAHDRLYVLDKEGPDVHIFDQYGNYLRSFLRLTSNPKVSIEEASEISVLNNGAFFILDKEKNVITHFDNEGNVIGTFGSQGRSAKGVFENAVDITHHPVIHNRVLVLDRGGKVIQSFDVPYNPGSDKKTTANRITIRDMEVDIPNFKSILSAGENRLYFIHEDNRGQVLAYDSSKEEIIQILQAEEAADIAKDKHNNIYVADRDAEEVIMFDSEGVLVRKFGQEIPEQLKKPESVATLSDGSILVSDSKNTDIKLWNSQGVFQKELLNDERSILEEPYTIRVDSKDNIYIWDTDKNSLFKFDSSGSLVENGILKLRGEEADDDPGEIMGFEIDPLDQIHIFNATTNQYEIFAWNDKPVVKFRYGRTGEGANSFENVERMGLNTSQFVAYVIHDKGDKMRAFQLVIKPPAPESEFMFSVEDGNLKVAIPESNFPAVTGYGLVKLSDESGQDTTVVQSQTPEFIIEKKLSEDSPNQNKPPKYAAFARSKTERSELTESFIDFFTYANQLFEADEHQLALQTHKKFLQQTNNSESVANYIADKYARLAEELASDFQLNKALLIGEQAYEITPDRTVPAEALSFVYRTQLEELARNEEFKKFTKQSESYLENSNSLIRGNLEAVLDSVALELLNSNTESSLQQGKKIYDLLLKLDDQTLANLYGMSLANKKLYEFKKTSGAPGFEQNVYLNEALNQAEKALEKVNNGKESKIEHAVKLLHADILLEDNKPDKVIEIALKELKNENISLSQQETISYRKKLARAYTQNEEYEAAVIEYQKILTADEKNTENKKLLAEALIRSESYDDAKLLYEQMLFEDQDNPELIAKIGEVELLKGNYAEASFQLEKALEIDPSMTSVYGLLARAYEGASNFEKALENYQIALRQKNRELEQIRKTSGGSNRVQPVREDITKYTANIAGIYSQMGQYDNAIDNYEKWTELEPSNSEAWHGLGTSYMSYGQVYDAIKALNTALQLNPTSESIDNDLSRARQLRDQISENRPPVEFVEINMNRIFPSLYRNYKNVNQHPVGEIVLANNTNLPIRDAQLTFYIKDLMDAPTEQEMKPLVGYSNTVIKLGAVFNKKILENTEDNTYQATFTLTYRNEGEEKTIEKSVETRVLGRNKITWQDKRRLAAFVSTESEEIINYTKQLDVLFKNFPDYDLNKNIRKAAQIYTTLNKNDFVYSVDPETRYSLVSTNTNILDFLQYPAETLKRKGGDCDDLVTAMSSLLEHSGVGTAYVDVPGHVFLAFDSGLKSSQLEDQGLKREEVIIQNNKVWIPVETTLIGSKDFITAWQSASERYNKEKKAGNFPELVTLSKARNVYTPSSYTPEDYSPSLPHKDTLVTEYTQQIQKLYARKTTQKQESLEQRRAEEPNNIFVRNELATIYAKADKLEEAKKVLEEGVEISPQNATLYNNLGNVEYKMGNYTKALKHYRKASELDPNDGEILVNITKVYVRLDERKKAFETFTEAVSLNEKLGEKYSYLNDQINQ